MQKKILVLLTILLVFFPSYVFALTYDTFSYSMDIFQGSYITNQPTASYFVDVYDGAYEYFSLPSYVFSIGQNIYLQSDSVRYAGIERFFSLETFSTISSNYQPVLEIDHNTLAPDTNMVLSCDFNASGNSASSFSADYRIRYKFGGSVWTTIGEQSTNFGANESSVYRHNMMVTDVFLSPDNLDNNIQVSLEQKRVGGTGTKTIYLDKPECHLIKAIDASGTKLNNLLVNIDQSTTSLTYEVVQPISFPAPSSSFSIFTIGGIQWLQTGAKGTPHARIVFGPVSPEYLRTVDEDGVGSSGVSGATSLLPGGFPADGNIEMKTTAGTGRMISNIFNIAISPDTNESVFVDLNDLSFGNGDFHLIKSLSFDNVGAIGDFRGDATVQYNCNNSECQIEVFLRVVGNGYDCNTVVRPNTSAETIGDYRAVSPQGLCSSVPVGTNFSGELWARTMSVGDVATTKGGILDFTKFNSEDVPTKSIFDVTLNVKDFDSGLDLNNVSVSCSDGIEFSFDMNSPEIQGFVEDTYDCNFLVTGYNSNIGFEIIADSDKSYTIYLRETTPPIITWLIPQDGNILNTTHLYVLINSADYLTIRDVNLWVNDILIDSNSYSSSDINYFKNIPQYIPYKINTIRFLIDDNIGASVDESISFYYKPMDSNISDGRNMFIMMSSNLNVILLILATLGGLILLLLFKPRD